MPGAGAGAVISGSGANHELRWRFEQFDHCGHSEHHPGDKRLPRRTADGDAQTDADQRPHTHSDADANLHASRFERDRRNDGGDEYGSIQRAGNLRFCE